MKEMIQATVRTTILHVAMAHVAMVVIQGVESVDIDDDTTVLVGGTQEAVQKALLYIECQVNSTCVESNTY